MTRVPELDIAALSPEQKRIRDEIAGRARRPGLAARSAYGCASRQSPTPPTGSATLCAPRAQSRNVCSN